MSYEIAYDKRIAKQMRKIPKKYQRQILKRTAALKDDPRPRGCKKLENDAGGGYRIRSGDYRILYDVEDKENLVFIRAVLIRGEAYMP